MGLFSTVQRILTGPQNSGMRQDYSLRSPDSTGSLVTAMFGDAEGLTFPVSVGQALSVPGVSRAIDMYTSAVSQMSLIASVDSDATVWLGHTDGIISPALRNVNMVLDLIFHRFTALAVARDADGTVINGLHIPKHMWAFDADGGIVYDGRPTAPDEVILVPSFKPLGFLDYAQDSIRQYRSICQTINDRADNPTPMLGIKAKDDMTADPDEVDQALEDWHNARKNPNGAVAFIPAGVDVEPIGADRDDAAMLIQARNAIRLDFANFLNLPAALIDGNSGTTDQYSNTLQDANEFLKLSTALYTGPIAARFSQDDVTPEGVSVRFDDSVFDTFKPATGNIGTATAPGMDTTK